VKDVQKAFDAAIKMVQFLPGNQSKLKTKMDMLKKQL
jgi:hypothetical protein